MHQFEEKTTRKLLGTILILLSFVLGNWACKKEKAEPTSILVQGFWKAERVAESGTLVYKRGDVNNLRPGYEQFSLNLSASGEVVLKEMDGSVFTGQWSLSPDNKKLLFKALSPQPTGTTGNLEYLVESTESSRLILSRTQVSLKTGGTVNEYALSK